MNDIIQILPDSVANQIAAGEVVQRPASVLKELVENAIDAGSTSIKVNLKDAGKTLIQVIDNGSGMSEGDSRRAFERHSTSKIRKASDLFAIRSMGFRGEALASIAAVASVELKTKRTNDELGTHLKITGSEIISQEAVACTNGSNFIVRNLFFNVPARRKFLKTNSTELRNAIAEFHRIAITNPDLSFQMIHNDSEIYNLPVENTRSRITNIFGRSINSRLVSIDTKTSIVNISGFIGKPQYAKKNFGEQFFFVNKRFMRHPYFHRAVVRAYDKILAPETIPSYFVFFEVDPKIIDINIHPTKTEIKFEDERSIFQIIQASIREALGKFNIVPSIDFDEDTSLEIPVTKKPHNLETPEIKVNSNFNPFDEKQDKTETRESYRKPIVEKPNSGKKPLSSIVPKEWEKLYEDTVDGTSTSPEQSNNIFSTPKPEGGAEKSFNEPASDKTEQQPKSEKVIESAQSFFHLKNKYILTSIRSGLMIIDQRRAHERILFEKFLASLENNQAIAQQTLFPQTIELNVSDYDLLKEVVDEVRTLGFDIREFGKNAFVINGTPADIQNCNPVELLENLLENYKSNQADVKLQIRENLARSLAKASAINYGKSLSNEEMGHIIDHLFACKIPNYTPDGKSIIFVLKMEELEKRFK